MTLSPNSNNFLLFLGFLLFFVPLAAQEPVVVERSSNKVILEGTVYYIHVVKPGQTIYSISRAYNISQKEIAIENPGVMSGLQVGQALKIPVEPTINQGIDTSTLDQTDASGQTHVVRRGETLYGIASQYHVDVNELSIANGGIKPAGLRPGLRLVIPEKKEGFGEASFNEEGFAFHTVKRRETLYSIARYYGIDVEEIRVANPELGWGGPKTGQVLRIPASQVVDHPEMILDTIDEEPLVFESPDTLSDIYEYEELRFEPDNLSRTYQIAFLIPFDFQVPEPLDSLIKDIKSVARRNRIIERYRMEESIPQAVNFLEFFQGALLAIDSLRQTGLKMDVRFFDTRKSMDHTLSILMEEGLEDFDLLMGPFYPFNLELVSAFAKQHRIPLVTPFYNELDLVAGNPYLFQLSPSIEVEYQEAAKLVASKHMYNIVYVREEDSLGVEKHDYFKELIFDGFDDYRPSEPVIFKEVVQKLDQVNEIIHSLSKDRKNLVVVPTSNEALASRVVSSLYFQLKDYHIELIGSPAWTEFSSIDFRYYHALNLMFYSSFWVDYLDPAIDAYMAGYRDHFYNEPKSTTRKGINYGIMGYDMTFYFLNALRMKGPRFILSLDRYVPDLVQQNYAFRRISKAGGYENRQVSFYQFYPDMSIRKIEVPDLPARHYFFRPFDDPRRRRFLYKERNWE